MSQPICPHIARALERAERRASKLVTQREDLLRAEARSDYLRNILDDSNRGPIDPLAIARRAREGLLNAVGRL